MPDNPSVALNILSFFFPFVGLIVYLAVKDVTPRRARGISKASMLGAAAYVLGIIFLSWLGSRITASVTNEWSDDIDKMMEETPTPKTQVKKKPKPSPSSGQKTR